MPDDDDRLTLLERAQLLHDATLRRHGEMLDGHEDSRLAHEAQMAAMREMQERQERLLETLAGLTADNAGQLAILRAMAAQHDEHMAALRQTLAAIKDMLDRGNGH